MANYKTAYRTHTCGELRKKDSGKVVKLCGWVDSIREHGRVAFLDLRDRYGKTQVVVKGKHGLKPEYCVQISGKVQARKKGTENKVLDTGEIEVLNEGIEVFGPAKIPPIEVSDSKIANDDLRLEYRYLDLRREGMQYNIEFRSRVAAAVREFYSKNGFVEIETPIFVKPTPEGARDYIVPSRVNPGKFFALPQSPQLYKQILMVSGFDRYYQIAKCMRDEDLRKDRQPEHTQIDLEVSFMSADEIMDNTEEMYRYVFNKVLGVKLKKFPRMTYEEAMSKYKTDKPDLRKNKEDPKEFAFCWVYDYPLFAYSDKDKMWVPEHHIFSSPKKEHVKFLEKDPGKVKGDLFDVILNGVELGSGSIRINSPELQGKVMKVIGLSQEEARKKFGFLLKAYEYGGPIHGGMGLGFDRLLALMLGYNDIREVIAFPRNKAAQNPMDGSPASVSEEQLKEVHIKVDKLESGEGEKKEKKRKKLR